MMPICPYTKAARSARALNAPHASSALFFFVGRTWRLLALLLLAANDAYSIPFAYFDDGKLSERTKEEAHGMKQEN
jgi:hypothetical protein